MGGGEVTPANANLEEETLLEVASELAKKAKETYETWMKKQVCKKIGANIKEEATWKFVKINKIFNYTRMPIYHPNKIYNFECVLVHKNIDCENKLKPVVFTLYFEVGDKTNIGRYTNSTELKVGSKKYPRFSICDVQGKEIDNKIPYLHFKLVNDDKSPSLMNEYKGLYLVIRGTMDDDKENIPPTLLANSM